MSEAVAQNTPNSSTRRSHTPEEANNEVRKRRRIALSCYDCRRRKLRCDREYPACGRCRKGGHPETCSYDSRAERPAATRDAHHPVVESDEDRANVLSPTSSNTVPRAPVVPDANQHGSRDSTDLLSVQRKKIAELETRLAQLEGKSQNPLPNGHAIQHAGDELLWPNAQPTHRRSASDGDENETMLIRGKAFETTYFGRSNITSVVITHVSLAPPQNLRGSSPESRRRHNITILDPQSCPETTMRCPRWQRCSSQNFRAFAPSCRPHSNSTPA